MIRSYAQLMKSELYTENCWAFWHEPKDSFQVSSEICSCGGKCFYRGFVKEKIVGLVYRAFSICHKCGKVEEF